MSKLAKAVKGRKSPTYRELIKVKTFGVFTGAWEKLNSDLNIPAALGELFGQIKKAENDEDWQGFYAILAALGLILPELENEIHDIPAAIQELAEKRWQARTEKDWAGSDKLRDALAAEGWIMKDGRENYELEPAP